METAY